LLLKYHLYLGDLASAVQKADFSNDVCIFSDFSNLLEKYLGEGACANGRMPRDRIPGLIPDLSRRPPKEGAS
ncbi:hypothetical protein CDAR_388331, partial [Caerostris darwini]